MSVNKVILVGNLGQNPEVRYAPSGLAIANFSIATSETWVDKSNQKQERTEWHRIVVMGKNAENCSKYLTKGRQVYVEGRVQTRQWQDKNGQTRYTTEILAQTVQFLGGTGTSSNVNSDALMSYLGPMNDAAPTKSQAESAIDAQAVPPPSSFLTEENIPF